MCIFMHAKPFQKIKKSFRTVPSCWLRATGYELSKATVFHLTPMAGAKGRGGPRWLQNSTGMARLALLLALTLIRVGEYAAIGSESKKLRAVQR